MSTIHADKASAIPYRLYSLMETDLDVRQFLTTIYRYIQLGVHIKAFYSKEYGKFHREIDEVCEFYVDDDNVPQSRIIYQKMMGKMMMCKPSAHLIEYLENQNLNVHDIIADLPDELPITEARDDINDEVNTNTNLGANMDGISTNPDVANSSVSNVASTSTPSNSNSDSAEGGNSIKQEVVNGQAETIPVVDSNNNIRLSDNVVSGENTGVAVQNQIPQQNVVASQIVAPQAQPVALAPAASVQPQVAQATTTPQVAQATTTPQVVQTNQNINQGLQNVVTAQSQVAQNVSVAPQISRLEA